MDVGAGEADQEDTRKVNAEGSFFLHLASLGRIEGCRYTQLSASRAQLARTQHCTCSALRRASRAVTAHYEAHFQGSELRATQFTILSTLAQTGALSMTQLADRLGVERTTLTRNLAVLARRGFVAYTGAKDGRVRKVEITRDGERTLHACLPRWAAAEASVRAVLQRLKLPQLSA